VGTKERNFELILPRCSQVVELWEGEAGWLDFVTGYSSPSRPRWTLHRSGFMSILSDRADHGDLLHLAVKVELVSINARASPSDPLAAALVVGTVAQCISSVCVAA